MSESIDYYVFVHFKTESARDKFRNHKNVEEFFDDIGDGYEKNSVELRESGGRGGGMSCQEILQEAIGALLEEFRDDIIKFEAYATYVEQAPTDTFELDDFVGKKIEA